MLQVLKKAVFGARAFKGKSKKDELDRRQEVVV